MEEMEAPRDRLPLVMHEMVSREARGHERPIETPVQGVRLRLSPASADRIDGQRVICAHVGFIRGGADRESALLGLTHETARVYVVRDPLDVDHIRTLGIDPLGPRFTAEAFQALLTANGRSQIKGVLTDQGVIAGVGNAYSDEALHMAKLSPFKPASGLLPAEVVALRGAIVSVLTSALERSAGKPASELKDTKRSGMRVHARTGLPCPACGDTVREVAFATKSLQYCPTCQTGGKPLADRRLSRLLK